MAKRNKNYRLARVGSVCFVSPPDGEMYIRARLTDGRVLTLRRGEMEPVIKEEARKRMGRTRIFIIHDRAFERSEAGTSEGEELVLELWAIIDTLGYDPDKLQRKVTRNAEITK